MTDWNKALNSVAIVIDLDGWTYSAQLVRDAADEMERLREVAQIEWDEWTENLKEIERLRHEIDVQCSSEYVERILKENERLRSALKRYGDHLSTCSSMDKMDSGTLFHRSDWPCDCGFKEAQR